MAQISIDALFMQTFLINSTKLKIIFVFSCFSLINYLNSLRFVLYSSFSWVPASLCMVNYAWCIVIGVSLILNSSFSKALA